MKINTALILCAGYGKRLNPITLKTPKPLIQVGKKNLLERAIDLLINHGIEEIAINVHHLSDQIKDFIKNNSFFVDKFKLVKNLDDLSEIYSNKKTTYCSILNEKLVQDGFNTEVQYIYKDYLDFSTEVLPKLMGKIYTYKTPLPFIDIGTKKNFEKSQKI